MVHFQDMAEIVAKLNSQIEGLQNKVNELEGKPADTGRKDGEKANLYPDP